MTQVGIAGRSDPYEFWHAALQGTPVGSDELPVYADRPQCGFYRMRRGIRAPWECVAIFERDGILIALADRNEVPPTSVWHWCCLNPITENAYHHALDTGQWGDVDDTILEKITVDVVNSHGAALGTAGAGNGSIAFLNRDCHVLEPVIGRTYVFYQGASVDVC